MATPKDQCGGELERLLKFLRDALPSALVLIALTAQWLFREEIGEKTFLLLYPALFFGALFGRFLPCLISTSLATIGAWYFFVPTYGSFEFRHRFDLFGLAVFTLTGFFFGLLSEKLRRGRINFQKAISDLLEAKNRKSLILEASLDCIISMDHKGKVVEFNSAAEKVFGYKRGEVLNLDMANLLIPQRYRERHRKGLSQYLQTGQGPVLGKRIEISAIRADGTEFPVELSIVPIKTNGFPFFTGFLRDISELKQAEQRVKASERKFTMIFENAPFALALVKMPSTVLADVNPAFVQLFGYSKEEVVGKTSGELGLHQDPEARKRIYDEFLCKGLVRGIDAKICTKSGRSLIASNNLDSIELDGQKYVLITIQDVTEERRLFASEERAKRRLKAQYNVMSILTGPKALKLTAPKVLAIICQDLEWDLGAFWVVGQEVNESNVLKNIEIWHRPSINAPEFVKATRSWTFPLGEDLPGRIWQSGRPAWINNVNADSNFPRYKISKKEGIHGAFGFPILDDNKVLGVMEFFSREIRSVDEELLESVSTLGRQIGQFMNHLAAEEALRKAVEARDEFLSIASHELKTPLTSLGLQLQMTKRAIKPEVNIAPTPQVLAKSINNSIKQVRSLTGLVNELLDVSRIQNGQLSLQFEDMDLPETIRDVVERFSEQLTQANCPVETDLNEKIIGHWDHQRMEQVLANLLSNIIKYAPGSQAMVSAKQADEYAVITIQDSGPGIASEKQNKIFDRFERATAATNISGLGLGLYVVKKIIEAHQGKILLKSIIGRGSKFIIEIPLRPTIQRPSIEMSGSINGF